MSIPPVAPVAQHAVPPMAPPPEVTQTPAVPAVAAAQNGAFDANANPNPENLEQAVATLNQGLRAWSTSLRFQIDEEANRVVIQVVDADTGEIVRQIPADEALALSREMGKLRDLAFRASA